MKNNICKICKEAKTLVNNYLCSECLIDLKNSFHYGIGGVRVNKEKFDRIIKRGYIISEELDKERNEIKN